MTKAKINWKNIVAYIQGNVRYRLYYSCFDFLLLPHIREQIGYRINSMRRTCFMEGSCEMCGCKTTHLQMANKSCDGSCYPPMLDRRSWKFIKRSLIYREANFGKVWKLDLIGKKFIGYK